jgi:branched-chain amino acid transport system ATP-binding protein
VEALLSVENLVVRYDRISAVQGVSLEVGEGEAVGLLGPNGAGKSTILSAIAGIVPAQGDIRLGGRSILGLDPEAIVGLGITSVPQGRRLFKRLTVAQNLQLGATTRQDGKDAVAGDIQEILDRFPILKEKWGDGAGALSGGQQQQLAIARALLARPRLLLLDEPSFGLDPHSVRRVFEIISELKSEGLAILLAEQNAIRAADAVDRLYVLRTGLVTRAGSARELRHEVDYEAEYLGAQE